MLRLHVIGNDNLIDVGGVKAKPAVFLAGHHTNELAKLLLISNPDSFGPPSRVEERTAAGSIDMPWCNSTETRTLLPAWVRQHPQPLHLDDDNMRLSLTEPSSGVGSQSKYKPLFCVVIDIVPLFAFWPTKVQCDPGSLSCPLELSLRLTGD